MSSAESEVISSSKGSSRRSCRIVEPGQLPRDSQSDLERLRTFYAGEMLQEHVLPIITYQSEISLRLLDWLVTNYAKTFACEYKLPNRTFPFNIHQSYRAKLSELGKGGFDPFCRDQRIYFRIDDHRKLLTTVGQLNFFRWAIENQVLVFAKTHLKAIEEHMNSAEVRQAPRRVRSDGRPAKRRELSQAKEPTATTYTGHFSLETH